jgi:hypothetical protein
MAVGSNTHGRADTGHVVAMMRMHDELESPRIVAPRHLGIRDRMLVARLPRHESGKTGTATLDEVEPLVIGQGGMAVGAGGRIEQLADHRDVGRGHVAFHLEPGHGGRVAAERDTAP